MTEISINRDIIEELVRFFNRMSRRLLVGLIINTSNISGVLEGILDDNIDDISKNHSLDELMSE